MRYLVTGKQMKQIDHHTITAIGIPSLVLMERAALCVTEELIRRIGQTDRILIVCGSGNNGADGLAIARMLSLKGYQATILILSEDQNGTEEWQLQYQIAKQLQIPVLSYQQRPPLDCEVLIDALFGVGPSRPIQGLAHQLLTDLAALKPKVTVAVDLPSGINADTGAVMGIALKADLTVTFGYQKLGTFLYPGKAYSGEVKIADIGFPPAARKTAGTSAYTYEQADLARIPLRRADGNKGSFGKVMIVAGAENMCGAAYLSGLGAYRSGAGLVKIVTVDKNRPVLQQLLPEAILSTFDPSQVTAKPEQFREWIKNECRWADVVVLGPGLGQDAYVDSLVEAVINGCAVPLIVDADGLNSIARNDHFKNILTPNTILTPHLGEMARLCGLTIAEIKQDFLDVVKQYADETQTICVLKDAVTAVAGPGRGIYLNSSGNSGMAKGGSGDVLTGVIAGLTAIGMEPYEGAVMGVYLHGRAGDLAVQQSGIHGMIARELADYIGKAMEADYEAILSVVCRN